MTRVIAGLAGGRRLKVPPAGVRPTGDRAREGLFNSLGSLLDLQGATVLDLYAGSGALGLEALSRGAAVLDLYAGSGALGLEALSRGAAAVTFVESSPRVLPVLEGNVAAVARAEATALLETERGLADHPGLAAEVAALATDERATYLEKA